jgi:hypothetical protein
MRFLALPGIEHHDHTCPAIAAAIVSLWSFRSTGGWQALNDLAQIACRILHDFWEGSGF